MWKVGLAAMMVGGCSHLHLDDPVHSAVVDRVAPLQLMACLGTEFESSETSVSCFAFETRSEQLRMGGLVHLPCQEVIEIAKTNQRYPWTTFSLLDDDLHLHGRYNPELGRWTLMSIPMRLRLKRRRKAEQWLDQANSSCGSLHG